MGAVFLLLWHTRAYTLTDALSLLTMRCNNGNTRDYDTAKGEWGWAREAPPSQKAPGGGDTVKKLKKKVRVCVCVCLRVCAHTRVPQTCM